MTVDYDMREGAVKVITVNIPSQTKDKKMKRKAQSTTRRLTATKRTSVDIGTAGTDPFEKKANISKLCCLYVI